jgi:magnesium transporter
MERYTWEYEGKTQKVIVLSAQEFEKKEPDVYAHSLLERSIKDIRFCRAFHYKDIISGTLVIPEKNHPVKKKDTLAFCLDGNDLYLIGQTQEIVKLLKGMSKTSQVAMTTTLMFLLDFMSYLISEDIYFLEEYNTQLEKYEMAMYEGKDIGAEQYIMTTRKDMNILASYYIQLSSMGETLENVVIQAKLPEAENVISLYIARVKQLYSMVETVKTYTDQIWNLKQTMLSDKQNKISRTLTVVSVIFLPLTLITGWFGMNFSHMPFIKSEAGYYGTLIVSILIVITEIVYIKKKGIWK